jgi:hypothetical protein
MSFVSEYRGGTLPVDWLGNYFCGVHLVDVGIGKTQEYSDSANVILEEYTSCPKYGMINNVWSSYRIPAMLHAKKNNFFHCDCFALHLYMINKRDQLR